MREELRDQAVALAAALDPHLVKQLSFSHADAGQPAFERIRELLTAYRDFVPDARGIYTMVLRNRRLVFGPESYADNDPMASSPGAVYLDPGAEDFRIFSDGRAYVVGPESDEYGSFVSAMAAVRDHDTGSVLMVVGIDVLAEDWQAKLLAARTPPLLVSGGVLLLLLFSVALLRWRRKGNAERRARWRQMETGLVFVHSILVLCFVLLWVNTTGNQMERQRFKHVSSAYTGLVQNELQDVSRALTSLAVFFEASELVDPDEFRIFTDPLLRLSGVPDAFVWIPEVTAEQLDVFRGGLSRIAGDEAELFELSDAKEKLAVAPRDVYYPVMYLEPAAVIPDLRGWDIATCESSAGAVRLCMASGLPAATRKHYGDKHCLISAGFWVFHRTQANWLFERESAADELRNIPGLVGSLIYPGLLMERALRFLDEDFASMRVYLLQPDMAGSYEVLAAWPADGETATPHRVNPLYVKPAFNLGIPLVVATAPLEDYQVDGIRPVHMAAGAGLFLSLALTALVAQMLRRAGVLDAMLTERSGELIEREAQYRSLFSSMVTGCALHEIICDGQGNPCDYRFLEVNPAFEKMTGLKAVGLIGRTVKEVLPKTEPFWIETYGRVALTGEAEHFEHYAEQLGRYFEVNAYSPKTGQFAVIVQDVTERKTEAQRKLEFDRRMQETQRLESLGVLAGGIAHDFNNILMAILGYADLAQQELSPVSPAMECIVEIENASRRAGELCKQMLAYSGKGHFVVHNFMLNDIVQEMLHLLKHSISKRAVLNLHLSHDLPALEGDATQIRQVVMNLVINASEALEEKSGSISVSTGAMDCDRKYLYDTFGMLDLAEGLYVVLEVSDTGCGMDAETINKVFDPFFTTKFTGRGLGLAAVMGIVRGHKGAMKVYSEQGRGTVFKVLFPASDSKPLTGVDGAKADVKGSGSKRGGLVLLVDDEETNRALGNRMLAKLGYEVITAADGVIATELYKQHGDEIICVVLDLTMPRMNGEETFRQLRGINPKVKVILASGYNKEELSERLGVKGFAAFLEKPYTSRDLAAILDRVLADQPAPV